MARYHSLVPSILHTVKELEEQPYPIVAFGRDYPDGHLIERHRHERAQLIYASAGVMRVDTPGGIWVVPPMRAIWVPAGIDHEIRISGRVSLRTLLISPWLRQSLPTDCCVIEVSPLLRELVLRIVARANVNVPQVVNAHVMELTLGEIRTLPILPMHIALPTDGRMSKICRGILENPADTRSCADWGASVGASSRTVDRKFLLETGDSFRVWRLRVRLLAALEQLAAKTPIALVAYDQGYRSPSAFAAMFKRMLGRPPSEFFG